MTTHKSLRLLLVLGLAAACGAPDVGYTSQQPPPAVTAVFDPISGNIPLPNDIVLASVPTTVPPAQQDLLNAFKAQGGFPNDQEVPVTVSFQKSTVASDGTVTNTAPDLDVTSLNAGTLVALVQTTTGVGTAPLDPIQPTDYVKGATSGTLTLHHKGRQPWPPGEYVVAVRGGPNGVKTTAGEAVHASPVFYLIAQGQNLNTEQNLALLRAQTGSTAAAQQAAAQLQPIVNQYLGCDAATPTCTSPTPTSAFAAVDHVFPHQEAAAMTTFAIAPIAGTQVQLDAGRGLVPLPIDLLRDPRPASNSCAACGHLTALAACTLAQGTLDAQGVCHDSKGNVSAAAQGFATLDGFSTTGPILAPTSDLVVAASVNGSSVKLFDLSNPAQPQLVSSSEYISEPFFATQSGLSSAVVLQPAGARCLDPNDPDCANGIPQSLFQTKPLKDNTSYAVVITNGVVDKTGKGLVPGTVAKILQFTHPLVDSSGNSQLAGIDNATAFGLETMRQQLVPVLNSAQVDKTKVAIAYTFKTQTIGLTAAQLAALPYGTGNATLSPATGTTKVHCSAAVSTNPNCDTDDVNTAFSQYGVNSALAGGVAYLIETVIPTFNKLLCNPGDTTCKDTGAFNPPTVQPVVEPINVLIAVPAPPYVGNCTPGATPCTIPLAIFHHGLTRGRGDMLPIAGAFMQAGFAVAAIDAAKHGDRSYCKAGSECISGVCTPDPALANEGDAPLPGPGHCQGGVADFVRAGGTAKGIPVASSNFLVSGNFFRTRDTNRQDIIDQSQLVRVLSPDPTGAQLGNLITTPLIGVQFDPSKLSFIGQSLGAIQGTMDVAANPRLVRAVLNVGGGPTTDIFTSSPAFSAGTAQLLGALGVTAGPNTGYLQFLVVSKMILDPADPVNYAPALLNASRALPNILADQTGNTKQAVKQGVLTQAAFCDQVVPNPLNYVLDSNVKPFTFPPDGTPGNFQLFVHGAADVTKDCPAPLSGLPPPSTAVTHGFLIDFVNQTITGVAQADAVGFLANPANLPPSLENH